MYIFWELTFLNNSRFFKLIASLVLGRTRTNRVGQTTLGDSTPIHSTPMYSTLCAIFLLTASISHLPQWLNYHLVWHRYYHYGSERDFLSISLSPPSTWCLILYKLKTLILCYNLWPMSVSVNHTQIDVWIYIVCIIFFYRFLLLILYFWI